MNLFLISIFLILYNVKCNILSKKCESWNEWSECENDYISRTCNYDYSIRDLKSCKNCGKWGNWSPCNNGITFRYLNNCAFIKDEKECTNNNEENNKIKNENPQGMLTNLSNEDLKKDNNKNEKTVLNNNDKQYKKENEELIFNDENSSQKLEINEDNDFSETFGNITEGNKKIDNGKSVKNIHLMTPSNSFNNESNTNEIRNENPIYENTKLPFIRENKKNEIKEHNYIYDINSIKRKKGENEDNNINLHNSNNEINKSYYNKKKVKKLRDNQNIKIINQKNEIDKNISKENLNSTVRMKTYDNTFNDENKNLYNFREIHENEYDTKNNDFKGKYNDSIKFNRIYIASGLGVVLILTGGIVGYIIHKEKKTDDFPIDSKEENYEVIFNDDTSKNKSIKALYEEEFWAFE
ncbi:merozoite TRAP-like protein, putative [Plasmodium gallinaceum]|uniref:Merozoite TRAP-like protein, putative n=1 Tax=Plasmodium gallinaceum TaxID=5849 RepID=A0A1J1GXK6_PLAGA|nr:merozoite TRAP-like protein, putative [Plasmodium gallinaceum]CRG97300.1 merozoite TRAP-like protein, putative [Plasmodium gallinaceum]